MDRGSGQTAWLLACQLDNAKLVSTLLQHGARLNARDKNGNTTLIVLAQSEFGSDADVIATANVLLHGENINSANNSGQTALMRYCATPPDDGGPGVWFPAAQILVDHGAAEAMAGNDNASSRYSLAGRERFGDLGNDIKAQGMAAGQAIRQLTAKDPNSGSTLATIIGNMGTAAWNDPIGTYASLEMLRGGFTLAEAGTRGALLQAAKSQLTKVIDDPTAASTARAAARAQYTKLDTAQGMLRQWRALQESRVTLKPPKTGATNPPGAGQVTADTNPTTPSGKSSFDASTGSKSWRRSWSDLFADQSRSANARTNRPNDSLSNKGQPVEPKKPIQLVHLTSNKAADSIGREGRLAAGGNAVFALDKSRVPKSTFGKKLVTGGVPDVSAEVSIPQELNRYFKPAPVIGPIGLARRYNGVYSAPFGTFDLNQQTFLPNVVRRGDGSYGPASSLGRAWNTVHQGIIDYGPDGVVYGIPAAIAVNRKYR